MIYEDIKIYIQTCLKQESKEIRWCDEIRFNQENQKDVAPGGFINPYGYFVIGTTIGGNAIVVSKHDSRICFADYSWYMDDEISYEDLLVDEEWHDISYNNQNVFKSLYPLASTASEFIEKLASTEIDKILAKID